VKLYDVVKLIGPPDVTTDPVTGNESRDWTTATRRTLPGVVQPVSSTESTADEQVTITRWRLFVRPTELTSSHRVEWRGLTLEVDGEVGQWVAPGGLHHLEAVLRRVAG